MKTVMQDENLDVNLNYDTSISKKLIFFFILTLEY